MAMETDLQACFSPEFGKLLLQSKKNLSSLSVSSFPRLHSVWSDTRPIIQPQFYTAPVAHGDPVLLERTIS